MLKECPFCGGKAELYSNEFEGVKVFSVSCQECACSTINIEDKEHVIKSWNNRVDLVSENNSGILSCPCCGGNAEVGEFEHEGNIFFAVICEKCGLTSQGSDKDSDVISFWNKRK